MQGRPISHELREVPHRIWYEAVLHRMHPRSVRCSFGQVLKNYIGKAARKQCIPTIPSRCLPTIPSQLLGRPI